VSQDKPVLYLLRYIFSDDCTYTSYEFVGVFSTEELAEAAKEPWMQRHGMVGHHHGCQWAEIELTQVDVPID
jgi:hypothetical protein